ncbi:MAG: HlyC/CorC family transporter, partial [Candidatus Hydrogenedentes bacterium]|nr:HlyC/CorC family transporter [Candidatus Hydrogenedentota bacterium]
AFFSIQKPRLRVLRQENKFTARLIVRLLNRPGQLLTTILVGNMFVNTVIGIVLGSRVVKVFEETFLLPTLAAYVLAVVVTTSVLVFFGEIFPKVSVVGAGEAYARIVAVPLTVVDRLLAPICRVLLWLTDLIFRVTRFYEIHAAPYITDEELKSVLTDGETPHDSAEKEGRQMIRRILEFRDVMLREILVPRPDVVALPDTATVAQARDLFREHEYSRIPVYHDDLDHVIGILFAKDLLPCLSKGDWDGPLAQYLRKVRYVPETMSVQDFVKMSQRLRTHMAVVVDEYGGTEGIVTLEDAISEVVGDIMDEDEDEEPGCVKIADGIYRLDGNLPLDELEELAGVALEDEEHETVAGFLMGKSDKILDAGDHIHHAGIVFTVESVDGKRADVVRMEILESADEEDHA